MNIINLKYAVKFDAAHRLFLYKGPCNNLHGHTWKVELELMGGVDPKSGMLLDFHDIKELARKTIMDKLDHGAIFNFEDKVMWQNLLSMKMKIYTLPCEPTCENLARAIYEMVAPILKAGVDPVRTIWLESVRVWESDHASATYEAIQQPPESMPEEAPEPL